MIKDKLKEALTPWIISETWHTNHQLDKKKFHQTLETVFNTLGTSVSYDDFEAAIDDLSRGFHPTMSDSYRKASVENFAKEAEVIGSYLGNMTNKNS